MTARPLAVTADAARDDPVVFHVLRVVLSCVQPERVLLFGSRSRREVRPDSDLDILVVADAGPRQSRLERELRESLGVLAMPVDVLLRTPTQVAHAAPSSFLATIVSTATDLYPPPTDSATET